MGAARWYRLRSRRAAESFVKEITRALDKIADAPQRWPADPTGTRKVRLPCFPFRIIYRETGETIQILAVAHAKRRPVIGVTDSKRDPGEITLPSETSGAGRESRRLSGVCRRGGR